LELRSHPTGGAHSAPQIAACKRREEDRGAGRKEREGRKREKRKG